MDQRKTDYSGSLVSQIETFIKSMFQKSGTGSISFRRQYIATFFGCAPSQINYVLATRFSSNHGYLVETKRGGGGFVKIVKLDLPPGNMDCVIDKIGTQLCQRSAEALISRFLDNGLITNREAGLFRVAIKREVLDISLPKRDEIRAKLIKAMLRELLRQDVN